MHSLPPSFSPSVGGAATESSRKGVETLLEVVVHTALHSVGLKSKINISVFSIMHVVLVQHVIQALVEVFKVE